MKIIILSLILSLWSNCLFSQDELAPKDVKIYIGADQQIPELREVKFAGEKASLVEWEDVDEKDFLDFQKWKIERQLKDENPLWKQNLQETRLSEKAGVVLDCIGECRNYRGLGYAKVKYLSKIMEGDEIFTMKDSYLWIYLMDGTLVRMSPESSLTIKEINRGKNANMIYARLNTGNILWWSRVNNQFEVKDFKETDSLFLPLTMYEANSRQTRFKVEEDDLFSFLQADTHHGKKYKRLNELIQKSNETASFPTHSFLTFPNGSVYGKNVVAEFIILNGNESYIKSRGQKKQGLVGDWEESDLTFFFRGFNNTNEVILELDQWYEVDKKGRNLSKADDINRFRMGEFITSNIPSILIAREILFQKHSSFMHDSSMTDLDLAQNHGYRLWEDFDSSETDLSKRIQFLKEYTRRIETTNLVVRERFNQKLRDRGDEVLNSEYSAKYYRRAIGHFYNYREGVSILSNNKEVLNSERKEFWKRIHERK